MQGSKISWTTNTFNPVLGCVKVSPECLHCYAETLVKNRMGKHLWGPKHKATRQITSDSYWRQPYSWAKAAKASGERARVFCGSLCDWAEDHPVTLSIIPRLWQVIRDTQEWLDWLLLTKRALNIHKRLPNDWGDGYRGVWLGVSIGLAAYTWRRDALVKIPAKVHFISAEPLLEDLSGVLDLTGIEWLIVGGESGSGFRPMPHEWARKLLVLARKRNVAYFFKQSSGSRTEMGTQLDGKTIQEYPLDRKPDVHSSLFSVEALK